MRESMEYPGIAELRDRLARAEVIAEELIKLNAERHALSCDPIIIHGCVEANLQSKLAASQERERILREGLGVYADPGSWTSATNLYGKDYCVWCREGRGLEVALNTFKAAEEVK